MARSSKWKPNRRKIANLDALSLPAGGVLLALSGPGLAVAAAEQAGEPLWHAIGLTLVCVPGFLFGVTLLYRGFKRYRLTRWSQY